MAPVMLVTGADRGIGFCIAQVLARQEPSSTILVAARTQSSAWDAVQKLKALDTHGTFEPMVLDVTSDQSMHALVALIKERHGKLDGKYTIIVSVLLYVSLMPPQSSSTMQASQLFLIRTFQTIVRCSIPSWTRTSPQLDC